MKVFNLWLFVSISLAGYGQVWSSFMEQWTKHKVVKHGQVGISVHDATTGNKISGYNDHISLIPASSLKMVTTISALHYLGADYRYKTSLAHDGVIGPDGTLQGNLYIVGSGDPSWGSDRIEGQANWLNALKDVVQKVKKAGITCIDGDIIADESIFDSYPVAPTWQWNDLGNYYAGGAWGLNINENEYAVYYNSDKRVGQYARILYTDPVVQDLVLQNEVTVDTAGSGDNAYIFGGPYDFKKRIIGTIPQDKKPFRIKGAIPDPPLFVVRKLKTMLAQSDIQSSGEQVKIKKLASDKKRVVFDHIASPTVKEIVKYTDFFSINQYCEALLKTIGLKEGQEGSGAMGIKYVEKYLDRLKIERDALHMADGSGLSARNLISAEVLSSFLAKSSMDIGLEEIKYILPKAGTSGTVKGVITSGPAAGNIWMKSGSMESIQSFSGLCKARSGKWVSFALLINGYQGKYRDIKPLAEQILHHIYKNH